MVMKPNKPMMKGLMKTVEKSKANMSADKKHGKPEGSMADKKQDSKTAKGLYNKLEASAEDKKVDKARKLKEGSPADVKQDLALAKKMVKSKKY